MSLRFYAGKVHIQEQVNEFVGNGAQLLVFRNLQSVEHSLHTYEHTAYIG